MKNKNKLLKGNIPAQLIGLAFPLLIGNILQQFYNTADSIIIGRFIGETAFAAVGVAGMVMNLAVFIIGGACTGTSVILAQLWGEGDLSAVRQEIHTSLILGIILTLILSFGGIALLPPVLNWINTPDGLVPYVTDYLLIIFSGLAATFLYNFLSSILRAAGNTHAALVFLMIAMLLNVLLDLVFVCLLGLGVSGAALATLLSQLFSALCCLAYIARVFPSLIPQKNDRKLEKRFLSKTIRFAAVSSMQQSSLYIGKILVQGSVNSLGTSAIAAYTAGGRIESILNSIGGSGSDAISIFSAQNTGAGNDKRSEKGFYIGLFLLIAGGILFSGMMFLTAGTWMNLFIAGASPQAAVWGIEYLQIIALFYPFCFSGHGFVGYFRGTGNMQMPFIGTTLQIVIRVVGSCFLAPSMGLSGVALATGLGWFLLIFYQVPSWRKIKNRLHI